MFYSFYYIAPLVIKNIILLFCCTPNPFFPLTSTLLLLLLLLFCTHRERERALNHTQKKKKRGWHSPYLSPTLPVPGGQTDRDLQVESSRSKFEFLPELPSYQKNINFHFFPRFICIAA
jgi:hypothetical protein